MQGPLGPQAMGSRGGRSQARRQAAAFCTGSWLRVPLVHTWLLRQFRAADGSFFSQLFCAITRCGGCRVAQASSSSPPQGTGQLCRGAAGTVVVAGCPPIQKATVVSNMRWCPCARGSSEVSSWSLGTFIKQWRVHRPPEEPGPHPVLGGPGPQSPWLRDRQNVLHVLQPVGQADRGDLRTVGAAERFRGGV